MTAALEGDEWSAARPGRTLPPGKTWYPFYRRLGGPQGRPGRAESLVPTGIRSRTVQPLVSRYTDWATRPTVKEVVDDIYDGVLSGNILKMNLHYVAFLAATVHVYFHCWPTFLLVTRPACFPREIFRRTVRRKIWMFDVDLKHNLLNT